MSGFRPYDPTGGSGGGFTLGPAQNVFTGADRTAAETARDLYDTNNPGWITNYDNDTNLNIRLEYADGGNEVVLYQVRNTGGTSWLDNSSATGVIGDTGAAGATGNSYFFASIQERNDFFGTPPNETLLKAGLPVVVNIGNDTESTFIWGGTTAPVSYDSTLWRLSSKEVNSGSLLLGQDGAKVQSASQLLGFTGANAQKRLISGVAYDDTGSENGQDPVLAVRTTLQLTDVFDTQLPKPQTYTLATTNDQLFVGYSFRPAEAGELRVEVFLGTDDTFPVVVNSYHAIVIGQVGTEVSIETGNDIQIDSGQDLFIRASGVDLFGGLQTVGPLAGQNVIYNTADVQLSSLVNHVVSDAALTPSSVPFVDANGRLTEDNANFNYNSVTKALTLNASLRSEFADVELLATNTTLWSSPDLFIVSDKTVFSFSSSNSTVRSHDITDLGNIKIIDTMTNPSGLAIQSYEVSPDNAAQTRVNSTGSKLPIGNFPVITGGSYSGLNEVIRTDPRGNYFDIDQAFVGNSVGTTLAAVTYGDFAAVRLAGNHIHAVDTDNNYYIYRIDGGALSPVGGIFNSAKIAVSRDIAINGNYAYWVCADGGGTCGFVVVDITDVAQPVIINEIDLGARYFKAEIKDNYLFLTGAENIFALKSYDISDPVNPLFLGDLSGYGANIDAISIKDNMAYIVGFSNSELIAVDISDPAVFVALDSLVLGSQPTNMEVFGNTLIITDNLSPANIRFIDITDPSALVEIGAIQSANTSSVGKPLIVGDRFYLPSKGVAGIEIYSLKGINYSSATINDLAADRVTAERLVRTSELDVSGASSFAGPVAMMMAGSVSGRSLFGTPNNVVHIGKKEDFPAPITGVINLLPNTTYNLYNPRPELGVNTIDLGTDVLMGPTGLNSVSVTSESLGSTILSTSSTGALFNTDNTFSGFFHIANIFFAAPNGNLLSINGVLPSGFEFFPRLFINNAGAFNFQGIGTVSTIGFNMTTGAFFAGIGGAGRGLTFTNTREALVNDVRFTDWANTPDTTIIRFIGNNDTNRITGCTFMLGDEISLFDISPNVPANNTVLLNSNTLEGGKEAYLTGDSGSITTFADVTISGTTTNVADGGGVAEFTFAGAGPVLVGAAMTLGGHTNDSYNGFFRVLTAGLVVTLADAITGVTIAYASNDSGTWISEATLVLTPDTTGLTTGTNVNINGTIEYNNDAVKVSSEGSDAAIIGNVVTSASIPDWTALGLTTNDAFILTSGSPLAFKIRAIAVGSLTLERTPGDAVNQGFLTTQYRPAFIWDVFPNISFKVGRRFISAETPSLATWSTGSANQIDQRVSASGNVGIPNTKSIASVTAQNTGMDNTVIGAANTFVNIILAAGAVGSARELRGTSRFVLSNAGTGEITYTGKEDFEGVLAAVLTVFAASSAPGYTFRILKNGSIDVGLIRSEVDAATGAVTTLPIAAPVTAITGDTFQIQVENVDNAIDIIVSRCTIEIQ